MNIAEFSVKNRVPVNLLLLIMVVGGIFGYRMMTREVFPVVSIDRVAISTIDVGVSPEEIERNLTIPIEEEIKGIKGIEHIESRSLEGVSMIEAEIEPGRDMKTVAQEIRTRIQRMEDLPEEPEDSVILELEFEAPVVMVGVSGGVLEDVLRDVADELEDQIERIEGVASVTMNGYREREIWIEVDPNRMYAFGISISEVIRAVRERNLDLAGGRLKGDRQELLLRTVGEFKDVSEIMKMVVRSNPEGRHIYLRDIGRATLTYEEEENYSRINGSRSITMNVTKKMDGNAIAIMDEIESIVDDLHDTLPSTVEISLTQNSALWIKSRLRTLYINGGIGFTLVCLTLILFLTWRMALWTALGILASFLGAFGVMYLMGQSINMISLFALIVVLGLVVDDAIIVTENIFRHMNMGYSSVEASILGTQQVLKPVIATVATTVAAFVPMLMMTGILGKFMKVIPTVVTLVLIMSLIEALIILPSHLADFGRSRRGVSGKSSRDGQWFHRLRHFYQKALVMCLRWRYGFILISIAVTGVLVAVAFYNQKFVLFGSKDTPGFVVSLEAQEGTKLEETGRLVTMIDDIAGTLRAEDVNAIVSLVGLQIDPSTGRPRTGSNIGHVYVELVDFDSPSRRNGYEVMDEMRGKLEGITGLKSLKVEALEGGPPLGAAVELKIRGDHLIRLREISDEVQDFLMGIPGVKDIRDDYSRGKKEMQFRVDPDKAALYGLNTTLIARELRASIEGEEASQIRWGNETIDIVVKFIEPYRNDYRYLQQVQIKNNRGDLVPLKSVVVPTIYEGVNAISRKDHRRAITVSADLDTDIITSRQVTKMIEARFGDLSRFYPGYDLSFGGETEEQRKSVSSLIRASIVAILVIYMILGGLFKSFLQPLLVLFAVPFGVIGVIIGHFIMNQTLSLLSLIGVVALLGVVVNDSLLLVDFINRARERGIGRWQSIVSAGRVRMRPILLTTLTTVLGLMALSFQTRGQAAFLAPMAISIVWGLLFATVLTLLLVPAIFAIADDIEAGLRKVFRERK